MGRLALMGAGGSGQVPPATPEWIAVGAADTTGTSSATPAYGTNSAGDLPLLVVAGRITSVTDPTGWSLWHASADYVGRRVFVYTRNTRFTGGESGTVTVTLTANSMTATIHTFRNVHTGSFFENATEIGSVANDNTMNVPSIGPAGSNRLAVLVAGCGTAVTFTDITGESGGTWALRDQASTTTGSDSAYGLYTAPLDSGGTISGGEAAITGVDEHATVGFCLRGVGT